MDNTDSEMIESLNILRPPVRRDYKTCRFGYQPNSVNFMSEWRKPKRRIRVKCGKRVRRSIHSSTSLVLKRTSDSQIFDRYPVVSYTNTSIQPQRPSVVRFDVKDIKEKPLIKVIVVPNDQPSEGKQSERNKLTKIFLNNSEDKNAIETKNVYLVVAGRNKEKIYEIKTAESATLSPTELKHEAISKAFNGDCFKQIIKSLNMERKKTNQANEIEFDHVCKCTCNRPEIQYDGACREIDTGRSKVKIYGQLGLTEDDRYILKCSATIDDKPVPTTFSTVGQKASDDLVQRHSRINRESIVPVDAQFEQRRNSSQARIDSLPTNDYLPRRSQPRDMSPRMTRESQRRSVEYPPVNDMAPRRTQQTQRRLTDFPPGNDMAPRITQQAQRRMTDSPPGNDMAPRRTQQTQRRITDCPPGNDMAKRITQQTQRRITDSPLGYDMAPRRTQQTQRRLTDSPPGYDMAPRITQQTQRRMTDFPPGNDMAPRITQQTQRRMTDFPPGIDMAPRITQQTQRRITDFPPGNDMAPRRTQQTQRRITDSPPGYDMAPRITQQTHRRITDASTGYDIAPRITQQTHRRITDASTGYDMAPRITQQTHRRITDASTGYDMAPRITQQTHRRITDASTGYDMAPRITQQTHRRITDYPPNDMAPRRTQQSQRWVDEYPPGNYMDSRKSQRKTLTCPPGYVLECRDGREVPPNETLELDYRNVSRETGNLMDPRHTLHPPRRTILEERYYSHDSQATQVNDDYYANENFMDIVHKSHPSTVDKDTQCTCNCEDYQIKETQSPLVIISVYPNPEVECKPTEVSENVEVDFYEYPAEFSQGQRRSSPRQLSEHIPVATALKDENIQECFGRNRTFIRKSYRIPSHSPTPQNMKNKNTNDQNKVIETRMVKTNARSQSPFNIPTNKSSVRSNISKTVKKQESKKSLASKQNITAPTKNSRNTQMSKMKSKSRSKNKCSGNQMKPKSLVADKHKKAINARIDKNNTMSPKHNVSAVSINIDSENEHYDVSFHQGKYRTDLLVRKTSKHSEKLNDSTVNFLPKSRTSMLTNCEKLTDNTPDIDIPIDETTSKLNPRDSLEISHRHNLKTEIETQTRIEPNNSVSKDDMRYFAPVKHFTGDNCNICDPLERDREIQQLLGVSRRVVSSQATDVQKDTFGYKHFITQPCLSDEKECKDILYSNVEFKGSLCSCCCVRRSCCRFLDTPSYIYTPRSSIKKIKRNASEKHQVGEKCVIDTTDPLCHEIVEPEEVIKPKKKPEEKKKKPKEKKKKPEVKKVEKPKKEKPPPPENKIVERKEPTVERTSVYQQLILNRNIHVFLQVEQFCKQKPISLSKEQYEKVKKTIQDTLSKDKPIAKINKKANKVECECVESLVSIGEVRRKKKQQEHKNDETEMQTEDKPAIKRTLSKSIKERFQKKTKKEEEVDTVILYSRDIQSRERANFKIGARQTMSSLEVRYASIAYLKHVTFSSANANCEFDPYFEPLLSESSLALKDPVSIETLFKGHKKSPTPNLGTSTLSCTSEPSCSASLKLFEKPNQAKRPFLKRLISCLVMRSDKTPRPLPTMPPKHAPTVDSSFDSYHFSTSLGALEMSSSLYDTSASFFSNHSVYPKNNKMKRSFLNSMRGLLHNKRS